MPATIARLLMCFGVVAGSVIIYVITFIGFEQARSVHDATALLIAAVFSGGWFGVGWVVVWRKVVQWTLGRVGWTIGIVFISLFAAGCYYSAMPLITRHSEHELGIFVGSLGWVMTWLIGTSLVWRENARERGERLRRMGIHAVACPDCGYNLTGLKEAKCPECGAVYTLDQLYASITEQRAELGGD